MKQENKTCLNCPFADDAEVIPFSNGSEAEYWHSSNCGECLNYESESQKEEDAKCKLAFYIDMGFVIGNIPLWVAKKIGVKSHDPLYGCVRLLSKCRCKRVEGDEELLF